MIHLNVAEFTHTPTSPGGQMLDRKRNIGSSECQDNPWQLDHWPAWEQRSSLIEFTGSSRDFHICSAILGLMLYNREHQRLVVTLFTCIKDPIHWTPLSFVVRFPTYLCQDVRCHTGHPRHQPYQPQASSACRGRWFEWRQDAYGWASLVPTSADGSSWSSQHHLGNLG